MKNQLQAINQNHRPEIEQLHNAFPNLDNDDLIYLRSHSFIRHFDSKNFINYEKSLAHYTLFVIKGFIRQFEIKGNSETTTSFYSSGQFILSKSMAGYNQSNEFIQIIGDCTILCFSESSLNYLCNTCSSFNDLYRKAIENELVKNRKQIFNLNCKDATDRYLDFVEENKLILQNFPQKHIASYLGIAPETLSRVRREIIRA